MSSCPLPPLAAQIIVPEQGCRVIMASDGLWDILTLSKAVKMARPKTTELAASTLVNSVLRDLRFNDDTSVIVIDVLPSPLSQFPTIALQVGGRVWNMLHTSGGWVGESTQEAYIQLNCLDQAGPPRGVHCQTSTASQAALHPSVRERRKPASSGFCGCIHTYIHTLTTLP